MSKKQSQKHPQQSKQTQPRTSQAISAASRMEALWRATTFSAASPLSPLLVAFAVNVVLFGLTYALFTPQFNTRDDIGMLLLAAGKIIALEPTQYLLFTNNILGGVLKALSSAAPSVSWYAWYIVASLFVAHWALSFIAFRKRPSWITVAVYAAYFLLLGVTMLLNLQFTMAGLMTGAAGAALILFSQPENKGQKGREERKEQSGLRAMLTAQNLCGIALLVLSCLIRAESFALALMCIAPVAAVVAGFSWNAISLNNASFKKQFLTSQLPAFGAALLLCAAAYLYHTKSYDSWGSFSATNALEHNRLCAQFTDYNLVKRHVMGEEDYATLLRKTGWTIMDFEMLQNWWYMNDTLYNPQRLNAALIEWSVYAGKVKSERVQRDDDEYQQKLRQQLRERTWQTWTSAAGAAGALLLVLGCVAFVRLDAKNLTAILVGAAACAAVVWYVNDQTLLRNAPERVFIPLFALLALLPLLLDAGDHTNTASMNTSVTNTAFSQAPQLRAGIAALLVVALIVPVSQSLSAAKALSDESRRNASEFATRVNTLAPKAENLYVIWAEGFPLEYIAPFSSLEWASNFHALWLAWSQTLPTSKAVLDRYGVSNIYTDLAAKPNVFLLITLNQLREPSLKYAERYTDFVRRHYPQFRLSSNVPVRPLQPVPATDDQLDPYRTYLELKFSFDSTRTDSDSAQMRQ